jgi:hypothetical protein
MNPADSASLLEPEPSPVVLPPAVPLELVVEVDDVTGSRPPVVLSSSGKLDGRRPRPVHAQTHANTPSSTRRRSTIQP